MDENETPEVVTEETTDAVDTPQEESTEEAAPKPKAEKPKRTPQEELAYFKGRIKRIEKDLGLAVESQKEEPKPKTGELDNADYALLTVKGYEHEDDIALIQKQMTKWDKPLREVLKDEDVVSKLASMKQEREVKAATPSSTKRAGSNATDDVDYWYQKYEQDGKLPEAMPKGMAEKLVNRKAGETDSRKNPFE